MFGFGKKKSQIKSPAEMSAFERRQSMAAKFEMEERARMADSGIPPPPPPATDLIGKDMFESPTKKKSSVLKSVGIKAADIPPPPPPSGASIQKADPEFVDFTVVPILLRAKVDHGEATKYGDSLKRLTEAEVKVILTNAIALVDDVKKCGIKVPAGFEKDVHDDMYWKAGTTGNRKSFVYYRPSETPTDPRPRSDGSQSHDPVERTREQSRQRASFAGKALPTLEESDPNRYKVKSRAKAAESLSHDLADIVSSLDGLKTKN